jgi:hypothetical protein
MVSQKRTFLRRGDGDPPGIAGGPFATGWPEITSKYRAPNIPVKITGVSLGRGRDGAGEVTAPASSGIFEDAKQVEVSTPDRRAMLDRDHPPLSIRRQCRLLGIARSGVYRPVPAEAEGSTSERPFPAAPAAHSVVPHRRLQVFTSGAVVGR